MARKSFYLWVHMMVLTAHNGRCVYCGAESEVMDHVIPLAGGGRHSTQNLVPACDDCNQSKSDAPLPQWIMRREFQKITYWRGTPLGEIRLLESYQDAHQECVRTIRRVEAVCQELATPERRRWFVQSFPGKRAPDNREQIRDLRLSYADQLREAHSRDFTTDPIRWTRPSSDFDDIMDAFFGKSSASSPTF